MSIKQKIFKNLSASLISFIWNSFLFFAMTPFMLTKLGAVNFGIISLTTALAGFLGFLDLGFTGAAVKKISENYAKKDFEKINNIVNLSLIVYVIMGIFAALILLVFANSSLVNVFRIEDVYIENLKFSLYISSINIIINMILGVYSNIPYAIQLNSVQAKYNMILTTLTNLTTVIFLIVGFGFKSVMVIKLFSSIVALIMFYHVGRKLIIGLNIKFYFHKGLFKEMLSFSIFNMITQLSQVFFAQFDRVLIGSMINVKAVTYYVVPMGAVLKLNNVITTIAGVVFPVTSELISMNNIEKVKELYYKSLRYIMLVSFTITIPIFLYADNILTIWIGEEFSHESGFVFKILLIANLLLSTNAVFYYMFNGMNMPKINALYVLATSSIRVGLCFLLIPKFKIYGAAFAFFISIGLIPILVCYFERTLKTSKFYFFNKVFIPLVINSVVVAIPFLMFKYVGTNIIILAILIIISSILFLILCIASRFIDKNDILTLKDIIKRP